MKFHDFIQIYRHVDAFVTPSNFLRQKLFEFKFKNKEIRHIPTFTYFDENLQPNMKKGDYGFYFGRISPEKGVEYIIKAYELLGDQYRLLIAGSTDSDEARRLMEYVNQKQLKNIEFVGFKSGTELNDLIQNSKYVLLPTIWYDNFPNVVLEAYMNSKPVIASNIGSLPEMVEDGHTGLLFEPKNIEELVGCIKKLDDDALLQKLIENTQVYLKKHYSADSHYKTLISLFNELIASNPLH